MRLTSSSSPPLLQLLGNRCTHYLTSVTRIQITYLGSAHCLALQNLMSGTSSQAYSLGNGNGFSVHKAIDKRKLVTDRKFIEANGPCRA
jgi:UDP-glucose 4-epimerase